MTKKKRLLIVDDMEEIRECYDEVFSASFDTRMASNITEAQHHLRTFKPDVVFLDVHLGESESTAGIRLLQQIKQEAPNTIVCMMTGYGALRYSLLDKGADAFFEKPCDFAEVLALLHEKGLL